MQFHFLYLLILNNIGNLYYNGFGVKKDYSKAKEYYQKSAKNGNIEVLHNIRFLSEKGF